MATSGYISGTFSGRPTSQFYLYISWSITQSIVGNYSDVSMELHFVRVSSYYYYNLGGFPNTSNIDGNTNYTDTTNFDLRPSAGDYLIRTVTQRVYHNADGTKNCYLGWSGDSETTLGTFNFGSTVAFDTIPREAYVTNAVSFTIGNNIPLTINNAGSLYVKALLYVNGTLIKTSNAGAVTSYTITPTSGENDAMYAQIPNATSCAMYVRLQTFSDAGYSVQVGGNRDQAGTASINQATNKPTFTTFSIASVAKTVDNTDKYSNVLVSSALNTLTGSTSKMIKGYTKARATVASADKMVALNSATAVKYRFANGSQYKDENYSAVADVTLDIDNCLVNSFTVTAYDSRSLTTTPSAQTFTNFAEYESCLLWGINLIRANGVDTPVTLQISGSYWKEYFGGGSDGVQNTITAHYRYKETTESWGAQSWESLTLDDTDGALSYDDYIEGDLGASGFDADKSYNVEVRIYDKLTNYILEGTINVGTPVLDMTKTGIALLGKYDDTAGGALQINGDFNILENATLVDSYDAYTRTDMHRQAVMNGNFDIWQRGTSASLSDITPTYVADRFGDYINKDGGTLPTLTRSRQTLTPGELDKSYYYSRLTTNGAGTSLGNSSSHRYIVGIENGVKYLCGDGKKVTVSFYARSSIAGKRIGVTLRQNYGTGGSPTATELIYGTNWTLTSSWQRFEYTFTTNTLSGKTFGTTNPDKIAIEFLYMWGTTIDEYVGATTAETYGGSGTIDIAQVQLNAGSVALPFFPKSFNEELLLCKRYYEKSAPYLTAPSGDAINAESWYSYAPSARYIVATPRYSVEKAISATPLIYDEAGNLNKVSTLDAGLSNTNNVSYGGLDKITTKGFRIYINTSAYGLRFCWAVDAEI